MNFIVILLLALDLRVVVFGYNYPAIGEQNSKNVEVVIYGGVNECPKIIQPLCGTNGKEFMYFKNKCHMDVKNYELLISGLMEYYECPLSFCNSECPKCNLVNEPVCAIEVLTGVTKTFPNPCEVQRRICTTKKEWQIVDSMACNTANINRNLNPTYTVFHNSDCPELCSLEYRPVCARFMTLEKEFLNECELKTTICQTKQKWNIIRRGPCELPAYNTITESFAIESDCPLENKALCAKLHNDMKSFNNKFGLENMISRFGDDWQIIKQEPYLQRRNDLQNNKCPEFCNNEYLPVCAEYKGELREFGNSCELLKARCETNTNWKIFRNGRCPFVPKSKVSCTTLCSKKFDPVCARFNNELRDFFNDCELQKSACQTNTNWKLVHKGSCFVNQFETLVESSCENEAFDPICVIYNHKTKTFDNVCQLAKEIERSGSSWSVLRKGSCTNTSSATNTFVDVDDTIYVAKESPTQKTTIKPIYTTTTATTADTTIEHKSATTAATSTTLKPVKYKATERAAITYETTTTPTTPTAISTANITTSENIKYASIKPSATNEYSLKEFDKKVDENFKVNNGKDVVVFNSSNSTESSCSRNSSFSCKGKSNDESYSSWEGEHILHSKETKYLEDNAKNYSQHDCDTNCTSAQRKSSTVNYEAYSKEDSLIDRDHEDNVSDSTTSSIVDKRSTETSESYSEDNDAIETTSELYSSVGSTFSSENYPTNYQNIVLENSKERESYNNSSLKNPKNIIAFSTEKGITENYSNNTKNILVKHKVKQTKGSGKSDKAAASRKYLISLSLSKLIEKQIRAILERTENSQSIEESASDEKYLNTTHRIKNSNLLDSDESLEVSESYKEYQMKISDYPETEVGNNPTSLNEMKEKFAEHHIEKQNRHENYNDSSTLANESKQNLQENVFAIQYSKQTETNSTNNNETNAANAYQTLLMKNNGARKENKTLINDRLNTLKANDTINHVLYKETESHRNYTNRDYNSPKYNASNSKKGEIYNGVVYKAPFYDAPTYNFIYTAPFNYHGFGPSYANPVVKQTNSGVVPINPFHNIFPVGGSFSNSIPIPTAMNYENNVLANKKKMPQSSLNSANNYVFSQPHLSPYRIPLVFPHDQYSHTNYVPQLPNFLSSKQERNNKMNYQLKEEHQNNLSPSEAYQSTKTHNKLLNNTSHYPTQISAVPYLHPPTFQQFPLHSTPSPLNAANSSHLSLNSTLLNKILETLKTMTNRY